MKVIYAGSFDPVTNGHLDIILRARNIFGEVVVAVLENKNKQAMFSIDERLDLLGEVLKDEENIEIDSFQGLLVDYAKSKKCRTIVRGIRSAQDYENEHILARANMYYKEGIETVFLLASNENLFVSSTLAKEVAQFNGDLSIFVPKLVGKAMIDKIKGGN
ncbi:Phosphopantetheine adenylyltransferase [Anaerosphaera aminiphila DSM 21120]|uniref:Phosphopantetheine adenylyltransferase n=1 Tax=Anaerosphaera aminiphila DSM 21120 TaxID=1120995 RepID=A0A1M5P2Z0_9FIRM|nr:pantetheine-phosphate adenylyltransferase [Anaerosphaera aminiphila]SHG96194.1 Phosphopantetheine adenylyltransferase [Anaerosphaera aminiphila DSM 21120]